MQEGVNVLKFNNDLQNVRCTLSKISLLPIPHISQPYNNTGFTILSKSPTDI